MDELKFDEKDVRTIISKIENHKENILCEISMCEEIEGSFQYIDNRQGDNETTFDMDDLEGYISDEESELDSEKKVWGDEYFHWVKVKVNNDWFLEELKEFVTNSDNGDYEDYYYGEENKYSLETFSVATEFWVGEPSMLIDELEGFEKLIDKGISDSNWGENNISFERFYQINGSDRVIKLFLL